MEPFICPTRNEMSHEELAEAMFGESTPTAVELISLKILVSALTVILLDKGICSRKEIQEYINNATSTYFTLKNLEDNKS